MKMDLSKKFKGCITSQAELNAQFDYCNKDTMMIVHEKV